MRMICLVAAPILTWLAAGLAPGAEPSPSPRPVATWAAGPMEVRAAFDGPVDPAVATGVVGGSIGFGEGEKAGEAGRPGGDRGSLRIASARLADGGRTLVLVTDPHPREATYTLALPGLKAAGEAGPGRRLDLSYDLAGVEASWAAEGSRRPEWSGWWPDFDPATARGLVAGSAEHDRLWPMLARPGRLTLRALFAPPTGEATVTIDAGAPFEANLGIETTRSVAAAAGSHRATLKAESTGDAIELSAVLATGPAASPRVRVAASTAKDPAPRALTRSSFVLPWAPPSPPTASTPATPAALISGGDPARGEVVFHGEQAKCATCHMVRGKGGAIGPDLTSLAGRDRAWVYQNIVEPSASIHPNYVSYTVALKDGRVAMGVVRAEGADALKVGDIDAKQTVIPRSDVEELRPSASSIMPVGLLAAIGEERTRDLLAFLTAPANPPAPAR